MGWSARSVSVVALVFVAGCASGTQTTTTTTTLAAETTTTVVTTTTLPETTTTAGTTTTETAPPDTTRGSTVFTVPFHFEVSEDSTLRLSGHGEREVVFADGRNEWLLFIPRSMDEWLTRLEDKDVTVSEPSPTSLGGAEGTMIDVSAGEDGQFILTENFGTDPGDMFRIHVVDVDGTPVSVLILASPEDFDAWTAEIEGLLESLDWGAGP